MIKVGIGQDSHRFSKDKKKSLILGGVEFSDEIGLEGNSDGDVVIHALCNALGSAIGKGSLSVYADKMFENRITDSAEYLKVALSQVEEVGYEINNISISIEAQKPKIEASKFKIKTRLADLTKINEDCVGITATTGENLTAFGRGEGVQVFVIVSLRKSILRK
jgi:2-C-methyl-D-erythritol 2,4-cyclodiphosphate synthase